MALNRREFIHDATGAAVLLGAVAFAGSESVGASQRNVDAPESDNPADPNAITDPDHEIGKPYVGWKEGELDLHFIHTGLTENCFHIFPDGTTMLLDTGDRDGDAFYKTSWNPLKSNEAGCEPKPDKSRKPGEWVARYISRLRPEIKTIDYVMASHFHSDHIGQVKLGVGMKGLAEPDKDYWVSGIAHVGEFYQFGKAFDRGYPNYDKPTPDAPSERANLVKFWNYAESEYGMKREAFQVGALDQINLVHAPDKYDFHIRNVASNGERWDGEGSPNVDYFELYPRNKKENKNENTRSIACVVQYGAFRFFTGGDLAGVLRDNDGNDVDYEGSVGKVVGHVDVCKTNHHSSGDAMRPSFCKALHPRVYITCCWWMGHLVEKTSDAMCDPSNYEGPRLLCPTDPHPLNYKWYKDKPWRKYLVEKGGHVVVKVIDGGARYKVYFLTAEDESMKVNLVFGPFESTCEGLGV